MSVATVRSRIINFYAKITKMAAVEIFFSKNEVFLSDFSVNKSSKIQKFYVILGLTVTIRVPNMYIKFRKDRSSSFGEKINTA